jgi:hypothetical protein
MTRALSRYRVVQCESTQGKWVNGIEEQVGAGAGVLDAVAEAHLRFMGMLRKESGHVGSDGDCS